MKRFLLRRGLISQNKFSYLTHNHGRGGQQVLEISAPTGGASGYLQSHLASAGRVGRGRRAGGGGSKGWLMPYFRSEHALGVAIGGVQTPPSPNRAPLLRYCWLVVVLLSAHFMFLIGVLFRGQTMHLQVYFWREGGGQFGFENINF